MSKKRRHRRFRLSVVAMWRYLLSIRDPSVPGVVIYSARAAKDWLITAGMAEHRFHRDTAHDALEALVLHGYIRLPPWQVQRDSARDAGGYRVDLLRDEMANLEDLGEHDQRMDDCFPRRRKVGPSLDSDGAGEPDPFAGDDDEVVPPEEDEDEEEPFPEEEEDEPTPE